MTMASQGEWADRNQRELVIALDAIRQALVTHASRNQCQSARAAVAKKAPAGSPSALNLLCSTFALSDFERAILLLCAGMELDAAFPRLCGEAQGDPARCYPTFSLGLAALPAPHWSALTPAAPLRRWRLIEVQASSGTPLVASPLRIDERILHYLTGLQFPDERLAGLLESVPAEELAPSHATLADRVAAAWRAGEASPDCQPALIQLIGPDQSAKYSIATAAAARLQFRLSCLSADQLPATAAELEALIRLWEREAALTSGVLLVDADMVDRGDARAVAQVSPVLERLHGPILLSALERWRPLRRPTLTIEVSKPTTQEQRDMWCGLLGTRAECLNGRLDMLVSQFDLSSHAIRASVRAATNSACEGDDLARTLWNESRAQSRPRLENLAQRVDTVCSWDELVLPEAELSLLGEIAGQVRRRMTVYRQWGFGASRRGLGISALFAGSSGTGKTLAAEVLANTLELDLYRIDLSSVVSKYIGETEKNLRRVFDAGEDGGAILFFDEADALFGKRSEVKDSHDRYANIEINYLLQRMESYRGLAVLATNMKSALDTAFLRRIRFVVNFPFPGDEQRAQIWSRIFPRSTPTENLDVSRLARLNIAGGNIRNIAMNAAFLAADAGEPVRMSHIWAAARREYAKIEKPLTEMEFGGRAQ
jgi:hypothetical protein